MHHVLIITKCKSIEEALFYIEKTIKENLSRSALENCIRADLYHIAGAAVTNFAETRSLYNKALVAPRFPLYNKPNQKGFLYRG